MLPRGPLGVGLAWIFLVGCPIPERSRRGGAQPDGIMSLQEVPRTQLSLSPLAPSQPASKPCGNLPEFSLLLGFLLPALAQGLWVLQSLPLEHPRGISWLGLPNTCKFPLVLH